MQHLAFRLEIQLAYVRELGADWKTAPVRLAAAREHALELAEELKSKGFEAYVTRRGGWHRVQVGAYGQRSNADAMARRLKRAGYEAIVV